MSNQIINSDTFIEVDDNFIRSNEIVAITKIYSYPVSKIPYFYFNIKLKDGRTIEISKSDRSEVKNIRTNLLLSMGIIK